MAVKKKVAKKKAVKKKAVFKKKSVTKFKLPDKKKKVLRDLSRFITMFYGREGGGKTTAAESFPDSLFFAFEPGVKHLSLYDFFDFNKMVPSWLGFRSAVDELVRIRPKKRMFKTAVLDTGDLAYQSCMEWIQTTRGLAHVSEDSSGKRDRSGRGWTELKNEYRGQILRLNNAGYGVVLTSHSKTKEVESSSGSKYDIIAPTMGGQAWNVMQAVTDFIFYIEYVRDSHGELKRILVTTGDELVTAKQRSPRTHGKMPKYLPLPDPDEDNETAYEVILRAYNGKHPGLNPATFRIGEAASKVGGKSLMSDSLKGKRKNLKKAKKKKKPVKKK